MVKETPGNTYQHPNVFVKIRDSIRSRGIRGTLKELLKPSISFLEAADIYRSLYLKIIRDNASVDDFNDALKGLQACFVVSAEAQNNIIHHGQSLQRIIQMRDSILRAVMESDYCQIKGGTKIKEIEWTLKDGQVLTPTISAK